MPHRVNKIKKFIKIIIHVLVDATIPVVHVLGVIAIDYVKKLTK